MGGKQNGEPGRINKKIMALHFSGSAATYENHAGLQREIAWQLVEWSLPRLEPDGRAPGSVLEVGCGTGFLTRFLLEKIQPDSCVAVDLAGGMIERARRYSYPLAPWFVQADGECLPFAPGSFELAASSTAFQWFGAPAESLARLARLLAPGGRLVFATLGRGTLVELKESYREAAGRLGIILTEGRYGPPLLDELELADSLKSAGFGRIEMERRTKREYFPGSRELFRSLKARGANNPNYRPMSLATERKLMHLVSETFERRFQVDGRVYATYEVIFGSCRKGEA